MQIQWVWRIALRIRQYRSPDALVQIARCASTDRRMRNFRAGNAAGSDREVVEKNEKYRQYQRIKIDWWRKFHFLLNPPFNWINWINQINNKLVRKSTSTQKFNFIFYSCFTMHFNKINVIIRCNLEKRDNFLVIFLKTIQLAKDKLKKGLHCHEKHRKTRQITFFCLIQLN